MYFERFFDRGLAQASYLIGCQRTGDALVVDPNRDVAQYLAAAQREGLRVTHVTETHIHADFVSGARELAERAGAALLLSDEGDADWKYAFAADAGARLLHDGDHFMVGNVRIDVRHTPGHTPEHLSFIVTDTPAAAGAWGVLTGDFVFVGDVGRPDLLEKAAGHVGTMESGARTLFRSLQRFRELPDHLQLWPGHGAGSACGKALGAVPSSTVGYEKIGNWAVATTDESDFVRMVLDGQPEPPRYFAEMKRINRDGPRVLGDRASPPRLGVDQLAHVLQRGDVVVDTRPARDFAAGHVPGTLNIPFGTSFAGWAGGLLPYDRDIYLLTNNSSHTGGGVEGAVRALAMIGLDRIAGAFGEDVLTAYAQDGGELQTITQRSAADMDAILADGSALVIDVRARSEWEAGHMPGVRNIPLGVLPEQISALPLGRPIVLHCQGGGRSSIAASLLQAHGIADVANLAGGYSAWKKRQE